MASGRAEIGATHVTFAILSVNRAGQASPAAARSDETPTNLNGHLDAAPGAPRKAAGSTEPMRSNPPFSRRGARRRPRFRFLSYCRCPPSYPLGPWPGRCWKRRCSVQRSPLVVRIRQANRCRQ
jgi:hypothetical protein